MKLISLNDDWAMIRAESGVANSLLPLHRRFTHIKCKAPVTESIRIKATSNWYDLKENKIALPSNVSMVVDGPCLTCQSCHLTLPDEIIEKAQFLLNDPMYCNEFKQDDQA